MLRAENADCTLCTKYNHHHESGFFRFKIGFFQEIEMSMISICLEKWRRMNTLILYSLPLFFTLNLSNENYDKRLKQINSILKMLKHTANTFVVIKSFNHNDVKICKYDVTNDDLMTHSLISHYSSVKCYFSQIFLELQR